MRTAEIPMLEPIAQACQGCGSAVAPAIPQTPPNVTPTIAPMAGPSISVGILASISRSRDTLYPNRHSMGYAPSANPYHYHLPASRDSYLFLSFTFSGVRSPA